MGKSKFLKWGLKINRKTKKQSNAKAVSQSLFFFSSYIILTLLPPFTNNYLLPRLLINFGSLKGDGNIESK